MQVRIPDFDLANAVPMWGDNPEAVTVINAGNVIPAAIERYIIRVMRAARRELDPVADAALIDDIDLFNKQEGQHAKLHAAYLQMLIDKGYPRLGEYEAAFIADTDRFLANESLAWNLAYCEGFESFGAASARFWVDGDVQAMCGDHGSEPMRLWMWHLAEEFEHRTVVHDVLHRLYDGDEAFALRKAGADFGRAHFGQHAAAAGQYMFEVLREGMTPEDRQASEAREQEAYLAMGMGIGDGLNWVYEPGYDPRDIAPPRDQDSTLAPYPVVSRTR